MRYLIMLSVLFISCEGPIGPAGDQGIQGITGQEGVDGIDGTDGTDGEQGVPGPGTRTLMSGPVASDEMFIAISGLTISDMPSMDVLICPFNFACVPLPYTVLTDFWADDFTVSFQPTNTGIWLFKAKALYEAWGTISATYVIVMVE